MSTEVVRTLRVSSECPTGRVGLLKEGHTRSRPSAPEIGMIRMRQRTKSVGDLDITSREKIKVSISALVSAMLLIIPIAAVLAG